MKKYKLNLDYCPNNNINSRKATNNPRKSNGTSIDKSKKVKFQLKSFISSFKIISQNFSSMVGKNMNYNKSFYGNDKQSNNDKSRLNT